MPRYYFYSADLYTREETQLTGGYHGIMTVDDDGKSASEVFGEVADLLQGQTQEYIQEIAKNSGTPALHAASSISFAPPAAAERRAVSMPQ